MIEVKYIGKSYALTKKMQREKGVNNTVIQALKDINFTCKPGRIFSLLGPNGAGKTTLLRLMATILQRTSGSMSIAGLDPVKEGKRVRQKIGFLTGSAGLYERLTTNELIKYFADLSDVDKVDFEKRSVFLQPPGSLPMNAIL